MKPSPVYRLSRLFVQVVVFAHVMTLLSLTAFAHAKLIRSQPRPNETVSVAPRVIELWFSEELEPRFNTIEVKNQAGNLVTLGEVVLAEDNKKAQVEVEQLTPGVYTVEWKALSADQHAMRGRFSFTVAPPAPAAGISTESPSPFLGNANEMRTVDDSVVLSWERTLVRWLSYLAMITLFGSYIFRLLVLEPALPTLEDSDAKSSLIIATRRILLVQWMSVIVLAGTTILALLMQAVEVFDVSLVESITPAVVGQVLSTGYGKSWLLQASSLIACFVVVVLLSLKSRHAKDSVFLWWLGLAAGAALLLAPSWTGHAMLSVKHFRFAVVSDWLHLLAGGAWLGGLFHLGLNWTAIKAVVPDHDRVAVLHGLIRSFTRVALPSVALLWLAGLYNAWAHIPDIQGLWLTSYGQTLIIKLLIVFIMLVLAAVNNYYFGRRVARLLRSDTSEQLTPNLEGGFLRSVRFEAGLGVVVLFVTAVLVFLTPARNHPAMDQPVTKSRQVPQFQTEQN